MTTADMLAVWNTYENAVAYLGSNGTTLQGRRQAIAERDACAAAMPKALGDALLLLREAEAQRDELIAALTAIANTLCAPSERNGATTYMRERARAALAKSNSKAEGAM